MLLFNFWQSVSDDNNVLNQESLCSIGSATNSVKCSGSFKTNSDFSIVDNKLIILRSNLQHSIFEICKYHEDFYLKKFPVFQSYCCDPFKQHTSKINSRLQEISLEMVKDAVVYLNEHLYPRKKLCGNCIQKFKKKIQDNDGHYDNVANDLSDLQLRHVMNVIANDNLHILPLNNEKDSNENTDSQRSDSLYDNPGLCSSESFTSSQISGDEIQQCLQCLRLSPLKVGKKHDDEKVAYLKRKIEKVNEAVEKRAKKLMKLDSAVDLSTGLKTDSDKLNSIMSEIKSKFTTFSRETQLQVLTIFVDYFPSSYLQTFFGVSRAKIENATKLKNNKGILALPDPK